MRKKFSLIMLQTVFFVILNTVLFKCTSEAKMRPMTSVKINLENEPIIGEITGLRISMIAPANLDLENAQIDCFLSKWIEIIDDTEYDIIFERYGVFSKEASQIWGNRIIFYKGPMKRGEKKEFFFKIRIPDGKRYIISTRSDILEIDLGEPEPPEWNPEVKQEIKIVPKPKAEVAGIRAKTGVEKAEELLDLRLSKETPPPFRTEFKIRTKDRPNVAYWNLKPELGQPLLIPLRYLIYSEEESPKVEVNLFLPEGIELVNDADYQISQEEGKTRVLLYSGPMRFKECKAFYLQVKPQTRALFYLTVQTHLTNLQNEGLFKQDNVEINLNPKRY